MARRIARAATPLVAIGMSLWLVCCAPADPVVARGGAWRITRGGNQSGSRQPCSMSMAWGPKCPQRFQTSSNGIPAASALRHESARIGPGVTITQA